MSLDVVIPTCDNIKSKGYSLYFTLRSLLSQSKTPDNIVIVENGNFEETQHKIKEDFGELVTVIDGTENGRNISYARNLGARYANSPLILFIDDDMVIGRSHFLEFMQERMKHFDFSCGANRFWTRTDWPTYLNRTYSINHIQNILRYKTYLPKSIERFSGNPSFHEYSFIGNFGFIKRSVFESVGRFDENYKEWSYQDTDLMFRLCAADYQYFLMYTDQIFVYHLSHEADKIKYQEHNRNLFSQKEKDLGLRFHLNHFFGIFDDGAFSILS